MKLLQVGDAGERDPGAGETLPMAGQHADQHCIAAETLIELIHGAGNPLGFEPRVAPAVTRLVEQVREHAVRRLQVIERHGNLLDRQGRARPDAARPHPVQQVEEGAAVLRAPAGGVRIEAQAAFQAGGESHSTGVIVHAAQPAGGLERQPAGDVDCLLRRAELRCHDVAVADGTPCGLDFRQVHAA